MLEAKAAISCEAHHEKIQNNRMEICLHEKEGPDDGLDA